MLSLRPQELKTVVVVLLKFHFGCAPIKATCPLKCASFVWILCLSWLLYRRFTGVTALLLANSIHYNTIINIIVLIYCWFYVHYIDILLILVVLVKHMWL